MSRPFRFPATEGSEGQRHVLATARNRDVGTMRKPTTHPRPQWQVSRPEEIWPCRNPSTRAPTRVIRHVKADGEPLTDWYVNPDSVTHPPDTNKPGAGNPCKPIAGWERWITSPGPRKNGVAPGTETVSYSD